jgi:pyruvate dehydrogenase E2 component (dihydrolipoamide acetyltransferase)
MVSVTLPQLSLSMEEGKVVRWLVSEGERVSAGQAIVEIETDKATMDVEASAGGVVHIVATEGAVVPVETILAEIRSSDDEGTPAGEPQREAAAPAEPSIAPAAPARVEADGRHIASPAARRIALERGVDVSRIEGSGPGGRIMARDVEQAAAPVATESRPAAPSGLRDAVVANITESWRQIPHIHVGGELAADGLAAAKREASERPGEKISITDLLILAVARALTDVPELNGAVGRPSQRIHLSLAVAGEGGVVAPVIRDVAELPLAEVARERARLVAAAREGTLDRHELAGGTFTLSNLGAYPVDFFAPIVSGPQLAMLATGRLVEKPVAIDGMLAVRARLWANVAIDHRGADGEAGGRFLAALEQRLSELPTSVPNRGAR